MYQSAKHQQQEVGRTEQQQKIDAICRSMKPIRKPAVRTVWNQCLQAFVEVR